LTDKPIEEILQKDGGIEYAFDCIGNQEVLNSGVKSLTPWGTQLVVGLGPPGNKVEATVSELLFGKTITGGYFGNRKSREANQQLVDKYVAGKLPIDQLITHRFKLEQINDAFDLLKAGKTLRAIIEF
jgi:Zn-dependent alcohol dehydrogenase